MAYGEDPRYKTDDYVHRFLSNGEELAVNKTERSDEQTHKLTDKEINK